MILEYNGETIEIDAFIDNLYSACDVGIRVYVNGMVQPFSTDENDVNSMQVLSVEKEKKKNFKMFFTPVTGEKGDKLNVSFVTMLNPAVVEYDPDFKTFGNNHKIMQTLIWTLNVNEDTKSEKTAISKEYKKKTISQKELDKKYITVNSYGTRNKLDDMVNIDLLKSGKAIDSTVVNFDNSDNLKIRLTAGIKAKYRVALYADHELIPFDDKNNYVDVDIDKYNYYDINVSVDKSLINNKNIYAVAVPICRFENYESMSVEKTDTHIIHFAE